jgi:hypothetical protein
MKKSLKRDLVKKKLGTREMKREKMIFKKQKDEAMSF